MRTGKVEEKVSRLMQTLGQPTRLQILLAIGDGEACVCHLEAVLGLRQAFISQHLMVLRNAKVLRTRREGRFIFYRLRDPKTLELIRLAAKVASVAVPPQLVNTEKSSPADCVCPSCAPVAG